MKLKNIISNLKFENIIYSRKNEFQKIRNIRNEKNIRKNMRNKNIILKSEHLAWMNKLKKSNTNFFYIIKYKEDIIGGLGFYNFNKSSLSGEWSFYVSEKKIFIGLGASIEIKALEFFFQNFKLDLIYCYVLKHNVDIIKLHVKFGFFKISFDEYFKNNPLNRELSNAVYLVLKKSRWENMSKLLYKKYLN